MKHTRLTMFIPVLAAMACSQLAGCAKKSTAPLPSPKTVLTGYYSLAGIYSINGNGSYTAKQSPPCLAGFSLDLMANNQMQLQDACLNIAGTWTFVNDVLTITEASGTGYIMAHVD